MANSEKKTKKRNFTQCEEEIIVGEVEKRRKMLSGGHRVGITNAIKALEWQKVADAVNAAASQPRAAAEIKKKWSDIKVDELHINCNIIVEHISLFFLQICVNLHFCCNLHLILFVLHCRSIRRVFVLLIVRLAL